MSRIITGPDGVEHEFPDETTDDVIKSTLQKTYGAPKPAPDNSWSGMGKEAVRSMGEGIAGLGDMVVGPGADIVTLTKDIFNPGKPGTAPPVFATPTRDLYNQNLPVTPGYENSWTREAGNVAGPTLLTLGAGSGPAIVRTAATEGLVPAATQAVTRTLPAVVGDTTLTTAGTLAGKEGGGSAGQAIGGDTGRQWGEALGGLFGGFTTPIVRGGTNIYLRSKLTDEESPQRLDYATTAGVTPDISLVGSPTGVAAAKQAPGYAAVRNAQQDQIDEALREAARARANRGQGPTLPISEPDIGRNVANAATEGANATHADADLIFGNMSETAGRNTPIDDSIVQRTLDNLRQTRSAVAQPTIDYYQNLLDAERKRGGLTWDAALEHRALARPSDSALSFDKNTHDAIAAAYTDALRNRAGQVGYSPQEFDAVNAQYGGLKQEQQILNDIGQKKAAPAYDELFSPENAGGENLDLLRQHGDANSLADILSQNFELKTRGSAAGLPSRLPDAKLYPGGPKWWADASEEMRQLYANTPELRDQIDATMNVIRADARRGGGAPAIVSSSHPTTAELTGGALALGRPDALFGALTGKALAYGARQYYGKKLLDPAFTTDLVQGQTGPMLTPLDLARVMAASVGAQQQSR